MNIYINVIDIVYLLVYRWF